MNNCTGGFLYGIALCGKNEMKFVDFVCFEASVARLSTSERNGVINEIVDAIFKAGRISEDDKDKIARAIIRRENEASTGLGKGVAVPHVKHAAVTEPVAAVGLSIEGIDFKSLDKQPVYSVVLLISPADKPETHLKAMECIFGHLQNDKFRSFLRQASTGEAIEDLLREADENPSL
jgi:mannitol/fructose-specific phosphotransferase system IIA component (Ntr-type)